MFPWAITQHRALAYQMETTMVSPATTPLPEKLGGGCDPNKGITKSMSPLPRNRQALTAMELDKHFANFSLFCMVSGIPTATSNFISNCWTVY